ncbi:MAG: hypothetical protein H8E73_06280 [Planctomycetes bacterium]|nr:hypothetical protein [Planctomycetota bacterium]MBL7154441.1 hypothetical protein [Phycisphaerae bacterium]
MNTSNLTQRNLSPWLTMLISLALLLASAGCPGYKKARVLRTFSSLEKEASKYGTVSAGAARVSYYNDCDLEESRGQLRKALCDKRDRLLKDPNMVPQAYLTSYASKSLAVALNWLNLKSQSDKPSSQNPPQTSAPDDPAARFGDLGAVLKAMMKGQAPQPTETELIGLRMAALKFIESELEELKLDLPADPNYRRVVLSLDLTAWVRGDAEAALVYIDLYPYKADAWCHRAANILKCQYPKLFKGLNPDDCKDTWPEALAEELGPAFDDPFECSMLDLPENLRGEDTSDLVGYCHRWLARNKLLPRIVQVERMGQAEYLVLGKGDYSGTRFDVGGALASGLGATATAQKSEQTEDLKATVRPLSLAFVAGQGRAGWLLRPSQVEGGRMRPTERRLRMVVDVPRNMKRMAVHVHKVFLDGDLNILAGADFKKQMDNLDKTRWNLARADDFYKICAAREKECSSPTHYRLMKSRMRNLLHQGWSEEIAVAIPKYKKDGKCPAQEKCKDKAEPKPVEKPGEQDKRKQQYTLKEQYTREEQYGAESKDRRRKQGKRKEQNQRTPKDKRKEKNKT